MEFFYYSKQWPGSFFKRATRFTHIILLELKRIVFKKIYVAEFDLTDDCNLRCVHCYHFRNSKTFDGVAVEIGIWEAKFVELYNAGIRRVLLIGGEPTIRMDVIKLAAKIFPYIDICSNGTIRIGDFYKQKIFVSVDGDRDTHDGIRGKGVFDKIIENYSGDHRVVISMTITNTNYKTIENVIKLAITNGFIGVSCDVYTPAPLLAETDPMLIEAEMRSKIIAEMYRLKRKYPSNFLMSKKAIEWFASPNHAEKPCYWRSAAIHFDSKLNEKLACEYYDCSYCGHFAGANLSLLNVLIKR